MSTKSVAWNESLTAPAADARGVGAYAVLLGRALFAAIFLISAPGHFMAGTIAFAAQQGVPFAGVLVPLSGVLALAGGLSVLLGYRAKLGAWILIAFLVPVTLALHKFWGIADPMTAQMQWAMFWKNVSILGGALVMTQLGAGPLSLDARRSRLASHGS